MSFCQRNSSLTQDNHKKLTMVTKTGQKLPTINLNSTNLNPGTSSWVSTSNKIRKALEEYGCFVAVYDKFSVDLHNKAVDVIKPMFDLPNEVKARNCSDLPYHGYYKPGKVMPLLESLGIGNAPIIDEVHNFANLLWPNGNPLFWYVFNHTLTYHTIFFSKICFGLESVDAIYALLTHSAQYFI